MRCSSEKRAIKPKGNTQRDKPIALARKIRLDDSSILEFRIIALVYVIAPMAQLINTGVVDWVESQKACRPMNTNAPKNTMRPRLSTGARIDKTAITKFCKLVTTPKLFLRTPSAAPRLAPENTKMNHCLRNSSLRKFISMSWKRVLSRKANAKLKPTNAQAALQHRTLLHACSCKSL